MLTMKTTQIFILDTFRRFSQIFDRLCHSFVNLIRFWHSLSSSGNRRVLLGEIQINAVICFLGSCSIWSWDMIRRYLPGIVPISPFSIRTLLPQTIWTLWLRRRDLFIRIKIIIQIRFLFRLSLLFRCI